MTLISDVAVLYVDPRGPYPKLVSSTKRKRKRESKERACANAKAWRAKNRDRHRAYTKAWENAHPGHTKARMRFLKTGWTREAFEAAWVAQSGCCAICGAQMTDDGKKGRSAVKADHCHRTKRTRALLCQSCNFAIGLLGDDPARARAAAVYLETHQ